jgi:pyridoxal phosphate enzyme (YggS family)
MTAIAANLQAVRTRIAAAERVGGPKSGGVTGATPDETSSVRLLAVSKTKPAEAIRAAYAAGQRAFAENYVQEGVDKAQALRELSIEWHFIGPVQSNKTRAIAAHFDWVHSIERERIAQRLSEQRDEQRTPLQVCLQVNVSGEASKSGVSPAEVAALARSVASLPRLQLRGLMCIPEPTHDVALQHRRFAQMRALLETLNADLGLNMDTLSMGMSDDLEAAIAEGATMVRIGTAIFGERN